MTLIIAHHGPDGIYVAADGRVTAGDTIVTDTYDKLGMVGDLIIGVIGSAWADRLTRAIKPGAKVEDIVRLADSVPDDSASATVLVASVSGITTIDSDGSVIHYVDTTVCCGSGSPWAEGFLGAYAAADHLLAIPGAFEVAARRTTSVGPLYRTMRIDT